MAHRQFASLSEQQWQGLLDPQAVLMDLKGIVPRGVGAIRL